MAEGRAERESVPLEAHGEWADARSPAGPGRHHREAERDARARAGADPARADDRLAVHLLSRDRGDHGVRPVAHPDDGAARAVLRRCPPVELRPVRGAGSPARLRSQRLRRDAAGAVRVGRQAAGGELRRRRPWQRPPSQGAARGGAHRRRRLPDDDRQGGHDALPRCLVHALRRRRAARRVRSHGQARPRRKSARKALAKAQTRTSLGSLAKFAAARRRPLPDQAAAAGDRAPTRDAARRLRADHPPGTRRLRALAAPGSARRARPLPLRGLRAKGRRRRLGRQRGDDAPADGRRARTIRCSCSSRRPTLRCSPRMRAPANTSTRASGWCTASGSCNPPATRSSAGSPGPASASTSSMSASCAT